MFFSLLPARAVLADLNADLIETYSALQRDWQTVSRLLRTYQDLHSPSFYYTMRSSTPRGQSTRAARLIYLNRTCWNGLYRVNLHGHFNVPIGTKQNVVLKADNFPAISRALQTALLRTSDFESIVRRAQPSDFIFADPPYVTAHSNNGFLKYNETLFSWNDQVRLKECLHTAARRGVLVMATNADTPSIRQLYAEGFTVRSLSRQSVVAAAADKRAMTRELVITSW